jgi:hypothetical protein
MGTQLLLRGQRTYPCLAYQHCTSQGLRLKAHLASQSSQDCGMMGKVPQTALMTLRQGEGMARVSSCITLLQAVYDLASYYCCCAIAHGQERPGSMAHDCKPYLQLVSTRKVGGQAMAMSTKRIEVLEAREAKAKRAGGADIARSEVRAVATDLTLEQIMGFRQTNRGTASNHPWT